MTHPVLILSKRIAYILLIIWVWGISPLVYFKSVSPHQGTAPYQIAILQQTPFTNDLSQALKSLKQSSGQKFNYFQKASQTGPFFEAEFHLPLSNPALSSLLGESSLAFLSLLNNYIPSAFAEPPLYTLIGETAWQLPPDKPPTP